jgi:hypothetical protein
MEKDVTLADMPAEVLADIVDKLDVKSALRLCKRRPFYQFCRENPFVLERLAKREVQQVAPYGAVCGNYLRTWKLIHDGQQTAYFLDDIPNADGNREIRLWKESFRNRWVNPNSAIIVLPGLLVPQGQYILVGTFESWSGFPFRLVQTAEEVNAYLDTIRADEYYREGLEDAVEAFNRWGHGTAELGPEDGDQVTLLIYRVEAL